MKTICANGYNGIINRRKDTFFGYQGWGSLARDEQGTLYAVASGFRVSHICPFGKTVMYISKNEGKTWSPPIVINDTYLDDRDAGILYMGNGRILVSWFTHSVHEYTNTYKDIIKGIAGPMAQDAVAGMLESFSKIPEDKVSAGSYMRISEDYGTTWSDIISLPVTAPHGPTMCNDGTLMYLGVKNYDDEGINIVRGCRDNVYFYKSYDGGYTWNLESRVAVPGWLSPEQILQEPHVIELPNGNILGAFRIEGQSPFTIGLCLSEDGGKTWGEIYPTGVSGSPPHLMVHSSGALICSYGRREAPCGQRAMVSYDLGKTWETEYVLNNAKNENDFDLGYPTTVELNDGSLMTAYYQRYEDDEKCSMLYTKWRLEDRD